VTANGAVSWIEYVASLAALYVCPTAIAVVGFKLSPSAL